MREAGTGEGAGRLVSGVDMDSTDGTSAWLFRGEGGGTEQVPQWGCRGATECERETEIGEGSRGSEREHAPQLGRSTWMAAEAGASWGGQ